MYFFNLTNAEEVMRGAKPIVQELGPFVYGFGRHTYNVTRNQARGTVSYTRVFRPAAPPTHCHRVSLALPAPAEAGRHAVVLRVPASRRGSRRECGDHAL